MADALSSLLSSITSVDAANRVDSSKVQDIYRQAKAKADASADLYSTIGNANVIIQGAENQGTLATQQARNKGANDLGVDLRQSSEQLSGLIQARNALADQRQQLSAQISAKQSVGFFDNPLQYITNQFTLDDDISKHNALNQQTSEIDNEIQTRNALAQGINTTQNQLQESVTAASAAANASKVQAVAQVNANAETLKGLTYGADGINAAIHTRDDELAHAFSGNTAQNQYEHLKIAQAQLKEMQEQHQWQREERRLKDKQKKTDDEIDSYAFQTIELGRRNRLGSSYVPTDVNSADAQLSLKLLKSGGDAGKLVNEDYLAGQRARLIDPSGNTRSLSASPANFADMVARKIPMDLPPAMESVKGVIGQAVSLAARAANDPQGNLDKKNKAAVDSFVNETAQKILDDQFKLVKPGDKTNVYQVPTPDRLLQNPELKATLLPLPITQKVIIPALQANTDLSDPNTVWGLAMDAVQKGNLSYKEALSLSMFYSRAAAVNLAAKQIGSVGLTPQRGYNVPVTTDPTAMFSIQEPVDLTKADDVGRAMNKYLSRSVGNAISLDQGLSQSKGKLNVKGVLLDPVDLPTPGSPPNIYNNNPAYWEAYRAREGAK